MSALHQELSRFDERLHGLTERAHRDFRSLVFVIIGSQFTAVSLAFAATRV
jgi:hypothetical protein